MSLRRAQLRHRLDRGITDDQVDHDDHRAQFLGELGALVHGLHGSGGDIQIGSFYLSGRGLSAVHGLHAIQKAVAPVHEGLGVDVLVVLGEVEAALSNTMSQ